MSEEQGEAIALTPDQLGFYTVSEGLNQPIYRSPAAGDGS